MKLINKILEILFPTKCLSCNAVISTDANFCKNCWQKLQFIKAPNCKICSYPFEINLQEHENYICGNCLKKPPFFDKTIAIYRYNSTIGRAIGHFKYGDQTFLAKKFAKILLSKAHDEINDCDIICAVALHKNKLRKRKFNQALLIAKNLASNKLIFDLLIRTKNQKSQVKLTQKQRIKNIKKAFSLNPKYQNFVKNKHIILVDDVITTSATANSCAKELKKFGAKKISVLTIAKTIF
jgi:ComF family protein